MIYSFFGMGISKKYTRNQFIPHFTIAYSESFSLICECPFKFVNFDFILYSILGRVNIFLQNIEKYLVHPKNNPLIKGIGEIK